MNGVSFDLAQGEILGLIGPNGSGKSTTFNVVAGLYPPTDGSILLEGREIGGLTPNEICQRGLARTFQIPRPFRKLSVLENADAGRLLRRLVADQPRARRRTARSRRSS